LEFSVWLVIVIAKVVGVNLSITAQSLKAGRDRHYRSRIDLTTLSRVLLKPVKTINHRPLTTPTCP